MKLFTSLVFILGVAAINGQSLKVVHIKGDLSKDKSETSLKIGDEVSEDDLLKYSSEDTKCILFNGSKKMSFNPSAGVKSGNISELFAATRDRQMIASRGDGDSTYLKVADYFGGDKYLFFGEAEEIHLSKSYVDKFGNNKFIIVDSEDKKALIELKGDKLKLIASNIFDAEQIEKKIKIYRVNPTNGEFVKETEVTFFNSNTKDFKNQVALIVELCSDSKDLDVVMESFKLLQNIYGNMSYDSWRAYYQTNFKDT